MSIIPASSVLAGVDLTDPRTHAERDVRPLFARLRRDEPVAWHEPPPGRDRGFWVLSRHADALRVSRDTARFSSARGNMLTTLLGDGDSAGNRMLVVSDAPRHTVLRTRMRRAFTAEALNEIGDHVRTTTRRLLAAAVLRGAAGEPVDAARDIAAHIPLGAICTMLDVPEADRPFVLAQTSLALASHEPVPATRQARLAQAQLLLYFARLARTRAASPGRDALSLLADSGIDEERLSEDEVVLNCYSLILGGDETTRLAMIGGIRALAENPEQWRRLRDGEVGLSDAVEEVLRWTSPVLHLGRSLTEDIDLHGRSLAAGDVATVWIPSANHDEREFTEPDRFDVGRQPNRHLTFAHGPHFCLGARMARGELEILLGELRDQVAELRPAGPATPVYSAFVGGSAGLPILMLPA